MTVHIGIVAYNSLRDLPDCFEGIGLQTISTLNITVVDNASSDGSAEWVAKNIPTATLIRNSRNIGFGNAHNQIISAVKFAQNDYYLALNPDVLMGPNYIQAIFDAIQDNARIGWATGKLVFPPTEDSTERIIYSVGHALFRSGYAVNIGHGMVDDGQFDQSRAIFGAAGAAVLMKAAFIQDLERDGQLYDPDMFLYGEDVDVDWRGQRGGWTCWYMAEAVAVHRGSNPSKNLRNHAVVNRYLSVLKNADGISLIFYNMPLIILHCWFRVMVTPRQGLWMIGRLIRLGPRKFRERQAVMVEKRDMQAWFKWAREQPTNQPTSIGERLRDFWEKRRS